MKFKYRITKYFTTGLLAGMTYEEFTNTEFRIGQLIERAIGGGSYRIILIERLEQTETVQSKSALT